MQRIAPYERRPVKKNGLFCFQASKTFKKQAAAQSGHSYHDSFGRGSSFLA